MACKTEHSLSDAAPPAGRHHRANPHLLAFSGDDARCGLRKLAEAAGVVEGRVEWKRRYERATNSWMGERWERDSERESSEWARTSNWTDTLNERANERTALTHSLSNALAVSLHAHRATQRRNRLLILEPAVSSSSSSSSSFITPKGQHMKMHLLVKHEIQAYNSHEPLKHAYKNYISYWNLNNQHSLLLQQLFAMYVECLA